MSETSSQLPTISQLPKLPLGFAESVARHCECWEPEDNRRKAPRYFVLKELTVQLQDKSGSPVGEPFLALLRDISTGGVSFAYPQYKRSAFAQIEWTDNRSQPRQARIRMIRIQSLGTFYLYAGHFIQ